MKSLNSEDSGYVHMRPSPEPSQSTSLQPPPALPRKISFSLMMI